MKTTTVPSYDDFISLVKKPRDSFGVFVNKANQKIDSLLTIEEKRWDNFISPILSIYHFDEYLLSVCDNFKDSGSMSQSNAAYLHGKINKWRQNFIRRDVLESLLNLVEGLSFKKNNENEYLYKLINVLATDLDVKCSPVVRRRITMVNSMNNSVHDCSERIHEVLNIREKREESTYFIVDSLALLRTFLPQGLKEAKDTSKKFSLKEKYALLLNNENFNHVMKSCPDRNFRKKVYMEFFKSKRSSKWHSSESVKEIIRTHYREAKEQGYSSVCRSISDKEGFSLSDITRFFNSAYSELFAVFSKELERLEDFAKNECGIYPLREWDKDYVCNLLKEKKLNKKDFKFDGKTVWNNLFNLVKKVFDYTLKELDVEKIYKNDKVLGVYDKKTLIGIFYVSVEERKGKYPLDFFNICHTNSVWGERVVPFSLISLNLSKGDFANLSNIKNLLHEFGHALQFVISNTTKKDVVLLSLNKNLEGIDDLLVEFPSQWFENYSKTPDFLYGVLKSSEGLLTRDEIKEYLDCYSFEDVEADWNLLFNCKVDWIFHRNEAALKCIDEKYIELCKEFGVYTCKNDKALVNFSHFHLKGKVFFYMFTKNLVSVFNLYFGHLSLKKQGDLMKNWLSSGYDVSIFDKFKESTDVFRFINSDRKKA